MLDIEKVKLMCQLAMFEEKNGKDMFEVGKYYKSDYISKQLFAALLHYTICFVLVLLLLAAFRAEQLFLLVDLTFLKSSGMLLLFAYFGGALLVAFVSYVGSAGRYDAVHRQELFYAAKLNRLLKLNVEKQRKDFEQEMIGSKRSVYGRREQAGAGRGQSRARRSRRAGR